MEKQFSLFEFSYKDAWVIRAAKSLSIDNITDEVIEIIRLQTTAAEHKAMPKEAQYATAWIYEEIKRICSCENEE